MEIFDHQKRKEIKLNITDCYPVSDSMRPSQPPICTQKVETLPLEDLADDLAAMDTVEELPEEEPKPKKLKVSDFLSKE